MTPKPDHVQNSHNVAHSASMPVALTAKFLRFLDSF